LFASNKVLTTELCGGWVSEDIRWLTVLAASSYKWRALPWLANAGNSAMSPHTEEEGSRHLS